MLAAPCSQPFPTVSSLERVIRRSWERHVLFSVMLELTYRCNLDCVFCYNDLGLRGTPLSLAQYRALLDELAAMQVLHLVLTGGEPLAHPDFFAIGGRARELGFCVRVKSNGHALRGGLARRLKAEVDPFVVDLSLHGATAATHDRQTRVVGSFDRLLGNVEEMLALGLRLKLNATLTAWNEDELPAMFDIADRFGLPLTINPTVSPRDDGDRGPLDLAATREGLLRFFRLADERAAAREAGGAPPRSESGRQADDGMPPTSASGNCGAGTGGLTIDPFGNVLPCVQWRRPVGNLHEASIESIWRGSGRLAEVRSINAAAGAKTASLAADGATSFCMGLSELETGDPLQLAPSAAALRDVTREHVRRSSPLRVIG
jgi:MoaA/NifB/PqqE/SkfB family radical SAM enzyme